MYTWDDAMTQFDAERPVNLSFIKFASEEMHSLFVDMLKRHKPFKEKDVQAFAEQYLVKCPSCDGNTMHIWQKDDEEYKCDIWARAKKLGLTDGL
jgi:hypothetical protein